MTSNKKISFAVLSCILLSSCSIGGSTAWKDDAGKEVAEKEIRARDRAVWNAKGRGIDLKQEKRDE
jgi:hypothetical protein